MHIYDIINSMICLYHRQYDFYTIELNVKQNKEMTNSPQTLYNFVDDLDYMHIHQGQRPTPANHRSRTAPKKCPYSLSNVGGVYHVFIIDFVLFNISLYV